MKLRPKGVKFCPGCPKKELVLKAAPQLIINPEEKKTDPKIVTIRTKPEKKITGGLF